MRHHKQLAIVTMQTIDLLIIADFIIPVIPKNTVWQDKAIAVTDGKIIDILPTDQAQRCYAPKETFRLKNHVIIPGLINAHTHSPMNLFRGLADDLPLMDWLHHHMWPAEAAVMSPESVKIGTQLAIGEMLLSGTTCFYDMFAFGEAIIEAVKACGMRALMGLNIMNVPNKWANDANECLKKSMAILNQNHGQLISFALAPHAPYTNTDQNLKDTRQLANQYQLPIMIHLHETQQEIQDSIKEYSMRPIARLDHLGFLGDDVLAIHMVHVNDEDLAIAKKHHLSIAHCPHANLKLGSGIADMKRLKDAGLTVAIGTDSVASNNDLNMFNEMRLASLMAKGLHQDSTAFCASSTLAMATIDGARAMGLDHLIGSIEIGKCADLVAFDLANPQTQPLYNPISALVYAGNANQVSHVWVNGLLKVNNHQLVDMNLEEILRQAEPFIKKAKAFQYPK
jgi:5-methylthioadenosine/S-adenosylhomocysteine deaminase